MAINAQPNTSLIGNMLSGAGERKIGLIINDFGPTCVDAGVLAGAKPRA